MKKQILLFATIAALLLALTSTAFASGSNPDTNNCTITVGQVQNQGNGTATVDISVENMPSTFNGTNVSVFIFTLDLSEGLSLEDISSDDVSSNPALPSKTKLALLDASNGFGKAIKIEKSSSGAWDTSFTNFTLTITMKIEEGTQNPSVTIEKAIVSGTTCDYTTTSSRVSIDGLDEPNIIYLSSDEDNSSENTNSSAAYTVSLITNSTEINPGDDLTVDVVVTGEAFAGCKIDITYDASVLTLSDESTNFETGTVEGTGSTIMVSFTDKTVTPGTEGVIVATIHFMVNENIVKDTTTTVSVSDADFSTSGQTEETEVSVTSKPITISIVTSSFTSSSYAGNYTLISYIPSGTLSSDEAVFYDGSQMYCLETGSGTQWLYLTGDKDTPDKELISINDAESEIIKIDRSGDVNGSGTLSIVDAQIAYDIAIGVHGDFTTGADMQMWLNADVNGDGKVTSADSLAIQSLIFDSLSSN